MSASENSNRYVEKKINLDNLYSSLVECFSVIVCGYLAGRWDLISQREAKGLDVFVRVFALPAMIFLSLAQLDLTEVNWTFLASILLSKSIVFLSVVIVTAFLIRPIHLGKLGLFSVFCTQSNDFALGYPILKALYGESHSNYPSYVYLLAPISLAFLNPIAYILLEISHFEKQNEDIQKIESEGAIQVIDASEVQGTSTEIEPQERIRERQSSRRHNPPERKSNAKLFTMVFLNIISNPVMLMTVLGICGNFVYEYIAFVEIILRAFASVFSTSALFALGLRMVGTVRKLKVDALVTPGILIITKLLVLPLVTREMISIMRPGTNANETRDLSSFGFIYGTIPSAPMVFVLSAQYDLEMDCTSTSLVVCTFMSAPLMYISAKMIFLKFVPADDYMKKLESFEFNIGLFGILFGIWLIILFLANKSFCKIPQKISGFLILSQIVLCIGVASRPFITTNPWFEYIQLTVVALGLYSSRIWTVLLALTLVLLETKSVCFVMKLIPFFIGLAWGIPIILVATICFVSFPDHPFGSLINPTSRFGLFQSIVTLILLVVCFIGTCVCLILQHRYQQKFAKYLVLVQEINAKDLRNVHETNIGEGSRYESDSTHGELPQDIVDIEDLVPDNRKSACASDCVGLCTSNFTCAEFQQGERDEELKQLNDEDINEDTEDREDQQNLQHIVLCLLLITAMFVNLMLFIWTLVVDDDISGLYIELLFFNVIMNTGQIFLSTLVFGFDSKGLMNLLTKRWRKFYYGADTIVLTPLDELGFETTHVCSQFVAHHLRKCEKDLAKNKRLRLKMYKNCFRGRELVAWLQAKYLAKNKEEAVQYASHLLDGRILRHVENRHHFENSELLYTFKQ